MKPRLILASASPARLRLLRGAGIEPTVMVSGVDESTVESSDPGELCAALARLKAQAVAARLRDAPRAADRALVLGCDSVLEMDGQTHGKPASAEQAAARWRVMSGRSGILHTGHCLIDVDAETMVEELASTTVTFADVTEAEIEAYVGTGEPMEVAGAFTIDSLGAWFVAGIDGDAGNVVGVSLPVLRRLLGRLGVGVPALWVG